MKYTFSPAADFDRLEEAAAELYVPSDVSAQVQRYRRLFSGFAETFGPCGRAAVFSAMNDHIFYIHSVVGDLGCVPFWLSETKPL